MIRSPRMLLSRHGDSRRAHRPLLLAGMVVSALVLGACGSTTPSTTTSTTMHVSATAEITTNWTTFFSGQTSAAKKIALLQNGAQFSQIIKGQASSALAKSVAAKVSKVSNITSTSAAVRYSISLGGKVALANQAGQAVLEGGTWKVSDASFCVLLGLESVSSPACPKS